MVWWGELCGGAVVCCAVLCCAVPEVCGGGVKQGEVGWGGVLCCAVLRCAVLCRAVLCRAVPCRAVLCCAVPVIARLLMAHTVLRYSERSITITCCVYALSALSRTPDHVSALLSASVCSPYPPTSQELRLVVTAQHSCVGPVALFSVTQSHVLMCLPVGILKCLGKPCA